MYKTLSLMFSFLLMLLHKLPELTWQILSFLTDSPVHLCSASAESPNEGAALVGQQL